MVGKSIWPVIIFTACALNIGPLTVGNYIDEDNPDFARLPVFPLIAEGKYDQAVVWLNSAIVKDPKNTILIECRANCYHAQKKYQLAIDDFSRCLVFRKLDLYLHYDRGQVYADMGNYEKALADFETVIKISGNKKDSLKRFYRLKVNALEHLNRTADAEIWCTKILEIEPTNFEVLAKRAALKRKLGRNLEAIADYSLILKSVPDDATVLKLRADTYGETKEWTKAVKDYTAAIAEEPELAPSIYEPRAKAYLKLGDSAKANADMAKAKTAK